MIFCRHTGGRETCRSSCAARGCDAARRTAPRPHHRQRPLPGGRDTRGPAALLTEAGAVLDELESLIRRINRTNAATQIEGGTLTDALARRDILRLRHGLLTAAASAAAGEGQRAYRQLRSELKMLPALPVAELRGQADDLARQLREVDTLVQRTNWEADLLD